MHLKKYSIISTIIIFILSFMSHYLYEWFPNDVFAIFFPVNESVWEHMKIIYSTSIFYGFFEFFIKYKNIKKNYFFSIFIGSVFNVIIYLLIFLPFFYMNIQNLLLDLFLLFITIYISQWLKYYIIYHIKNICLLNYFSILLIILVFTVFGYLTYNPIKNDLFLDENKQKYGINTYII